MPMFNADAIGKTENNPGQLISIFPVRFTIVSVLIYMQGQQINTDLRLRLDATLLIKEKNDLQPTHRPPYHETVEPPNVRYDAYAIWTNEQPNQQRSYYLHTPGRGRVDACKEIALMSRDV